MQKSIEKNRNSSDIFFNNSYENEGNLFINDVNKKDIIKKRGIIFELKKKKIKIQNKILFFYIIVLLIIPIILFFLIKFIKSLNSRQSFSDFLFEDLNSDKILKKIKSNETLNSIIIDENTISLDTLKLMNDTYMAKNRLLWNNLEPNFNEIKQEIKSYENLNITINITKKEELFKRENPKISIIITVYNQQKYLKRVYLSILKQDLKNLEIIFIDDASTDNSSNIIKEFMIEDKRIIYLKNDINRRTYYSRSKGIYNAKGEYILIIDPDDFIFNNILTKVYETAKYFNLDILQFYMFIGDRLFKEVKYKNGILYGPKVKDIFYYGFSRNIVDKLIKKDIFIKALEFMDEEYRKERFQIHDDDVCFYGLINSANSYGFLEDVGYKYTLGNPNSTMGSRFNPENMDNIFHPLFIIMKYFYEKSGNNTFEKKYVGYNFFKKKVKLYQKYIKYLKKEFYFCEQVLDIYLNSSFLSPADKKDLISFKSDINAFSVKNRTFI